MNINRVELFYVVAAAVSGGRSADEDIGSYTANDLPNTYGMAHFSRPRSQEGWQSG